MSEVGITFDVAMIALAVLGVLVAYAIHVAHLFRNGLKRLIGIADGAAMAQRSALLKGEERSIALRIGGALCIAAFAVILAYAFARKIHLI